MADTTRSTEFHAARPLEQRLDALAEQTGVPRAALAAGAVALGGAAGVAGAVPLADGFSRAVAARRTSLAAKVGMGAAAGAGVIAAIVLLAVRVQSEPPPPPPVEEEPTFWNLRQGVADPAALDQVPALNAATGGGPAPAVGVSPASWPEDVRP